jgi:cobalt-zinc-cadmium efflux system membrane fusion protein
MKSRFSLVIAVLCLIGGIWIVTWWKGVSLNARSEPETATPSADDDSLVVLTAGLRQAANIKAVPVELRALQRRVIVPGRLQYDDTLHVDLRAIVSGIITEISVKPGDRVEKGAVLAVASSPDIGQARSDVLMRQAELELAVQRQQWANQVVKGIDDLIAGIKDRKSAEEIRQATSENNLGEHREKLMTAYSRFWLATELSSRLSGIVDSGAIARRTTLERQAEDEAARSALQAAIEQSKHDGTMQAREAEILVADARRRLELARQTLKSILGPGAGDSLGETGLELARVEIRAPFAGEIQRRTCTVSERVNVGDSMFVLADSSHLWVSADVREQEWEASALTAGCRLRVVVPALHNESFDAELYYVGREVSLDAHSLPIMGRLDNSRGQLRPGLFVQVELPIGPAVKRLAVPDEAVQTKDGHPVVYVEEAEDRYRCAEIKIGATSDGWTEVLQGVTVGDRVVSEGAFLLKSEQLLEREPE